MTRMVESAGCESLVSFPGMYSFNFWAGRDSPTALNVTAWPLLTPNEQRRVIGDIERAGYVCVLTNGDVEKEFVKTDVSRDPLMAWRRAYGGRLVGGFDGYELRATGSPGAASPPGRLPAARRPRPQ
jgi:hypothetical protein